MILFLILFTFLVTTALFGVLLWFACRRVVAHLQKHPAGRQAFTEHILAPLFGRGADSKEDLGPP